MALAPLAPCRLLPEAGLAGRRALLDSLADLDLTQEIRRDEETRGKRVVQKVVKKMKEKKAVKQRKSEEAAAKEETARVGLMKGATLVLSN